MLFDVFNFLSECFQFGLRHAGDRRGRARELKTRGQDGPVVIELKYRERSGQPIITYHLVIDERGKGPVVVEELAAMTAWRLYPFGSWISMRDKAELSVARSRMKVTEESMCRCAHRTS